MSTHTTYFCDDCNSDRDISHGDDDGHAINYGEYPLGDGWAEFQKPYTDGLGHKREAEYSVCAHCLADPDFNQRDYGVIHDWDAESRENLETGRKHAEAFAWALEHLGEPGHFGMRGVQQIFGRQHGRIGPRLADDRFSPSDRVRSTELAAA